MTLTYFIGNRTLEDCVGSLSFCQGMAYVLAFFIVRRVPMSERPIGPKFLLDSLRSLHVMAIRALFSVNTIASMNSLQMSFPNCEAIIKDFNSTQNS